MSSLTAFAEPARTEHVKPKPSKVAPAIVEVIQATMAKMYGTFLSEKPSEEFISQNHHAGSCIAGIITFLGDEKFSFTWLLSHDVAPIIAKRFSGFDIPYDSADMGDVVGELVNVLAGEIVAQLESKKIVVRMTLPTVVKGSPLVLMPEVSPEVVNIEYVSKEGIFWFRLAAAVSNSFRQSGK